MLHIGQISGREAFEADLVVGSSMECDMLVEGCGSSGVQAVVGRGNPICGATRHTKL